MTVVVTSIQRQTGPHLEESAVNNMPHWYFAGSRSVRFTLDPPYSEKVAVNRRGEPRDATSGRVFCAARDARR